MKKSILAAALLSGTVASFALGASPASASTAALPPGCHTARLDGGRTAVASCGLGSYTHHVWCSYGANVDGYHEWFDVSSEITCPGSYRVSSQTISES